MAKTANSYVSDQGEVIITLSAANITAITAFTTAEAITLDGAVRKFEQTGVPERTIAETRVTGDVAPIVTAGATKSMEEWTLTLIDDYSEGTAGEWGTDLLAAYEIFVELDAASEHPTSLEVTQAGGTTGDIETTLVDPKIKSVSQPMADADATTPSEVIVVINCSSHTKAAHA